MIAPDLFFEALARAGIEFFAGVPDSLLKSFCAVVEQRAAGSHLIAANEGNAVAVALGYHLATGKVAGVYLQNSGLGNTVNPLTSLLDREVYRVPVLLIIGWRGEPGVHDEPQHVKQGRVTRGQLELLEIPYWIVDGDSDADSIARTAVEAATTHGAPVALLVRQDAFAEFPRVKNAPRSATMKREEALRHLLALAHDDLVIATTGKTSREVFELRKQAGQAQRDFLTVGGMGHTSSIALGVAMGNPQRRVLCIDGDGSALMHLGALPIIGSVAPGNLLHVLLNNAAHESVGGQPTVADAIDFESLSRACGYRNFRRCDSAKGLAEGWRELRGLPGPSLFQIDIAVGSRADLGRPTSTPEQNKLAFMAAARQAG